jgi:DNA-binding response OmpR family regulator
MERTVLIIEDEKDLNKMITDYLEAAGFQTYSALNGKDGLDVLNNNRNIDLILLDVMMPGLDGFETARRIRAVSTKVPILFLTARSEEGDKVLGLEIGGDDYLTKPFSLKELTARIRALIRRAGGWDEEKKADGESLQFGGLVLDVVRRQLRVGQSRHDLTATQFSLMSAFLRNPGRVFSRMDLLRTFQDDPWEGYERTVDAHIKNLRKITEEDPGNPRYLVTVWGQGYKLNDTP